MHIYHRSLNVGNICKLFNNHQYSLEILEKLGFNWQNDRLILQYESLELSTVINNIKYCQLRYNISSRLVSAVNDVLKYHYDEHGTHINNKSTNTDTKPSDVDELIDEIIDQLPTCIMEENAGDIDKFCKNNDFQGLAQFLSKVKMNYDKKNIKLYSNTVFNIDDKVLAKEVEKLTGCSLTLPESVNLIATNGDNGQAEHEISRSLVKWLFGLRFPSVVVNGLIQMIIDFNFDLMNKDDRLWLERIVTDRYVCVWAYGTQERLQSHVNQFIVKYVDTFDSFLAKDEWASDLHILFRRLALNPAPIRTIRDNLNREYRLGTTNDNLLKEFRRVAKQVTVKWQQFESESKQLCHLLLNENNKSEWNCYYCNETNKSNINQCLNCSKGINPLYPARYNKSETFCVNKPFGLIKWNCNYNVCH